MFTRRRLLAAIIPGLAAVSGGVAFAGYRQGGCPLSSAGYCVGPCTAFRDGDGDLVCDRIASVSVLPASACVTDCEDICEGSACVSDSSAADVAAADAPSGGEPAQVDAVATQLPVVEMTEAEPTAVVEPTRVPTPTATAEAVASPKRAVGMCPFRLLNDPYPGRCRRYIDLDGNGICDYSEPPSAGAQ